LLASLTYVTARRVRILLFLFRRGVVEQHDTRNNATLTYFNYHVYVLESGTHLLLSGSDDLILDMHKNSDQNLSTFGGNAKTRNSK
jgi:hypothetical protein